MFWHLNYFEVLDFVAINFEAEQCADCVNAEVPSGARVHGEERERAVVLHFQDVRVAADKELRAHVDEAVIDLGIVVTWVTADVGHQHIHLLAAESQKLGEFVAHRAAVDVAIDATQRVQFGKAVGHLTVTKVATVPHLVALAQVLDDAVVEAAVRVRK